MKPGHTPHAPWVMRQIGSATGGCPNAARAFIGYTYAHLRGGGEYTQLTTWATLLDGRVGQLAALGLGLAGMEADPTVEILCSELAAMDYLLRSGDELGAQEMRAALTGDSYLASMAARTAALGVSKNAAKLEEYRRQSGKPGKRRNEPKGTGKGGGLGAPAAGTGEGRGRIECFRCGEFGHTARVCEAARPRAAQS